MDKETSKHIGRIMEKAMMSNSTFDKDRPLSVKELSEKIERLESENDLLKRNLGRVPLSKWYEYRLDSVEELTPKTLDNEKMYTSGELALDMAAFKLDEDFMKRYSRWVDAKMMGTTKVNFDEWDK